jgi:hypothetical protein
MRYYSMPKRSSKPLPDFNQIAAQIVQAATEPSKPTAKEKPRKKNPAAVALGRLGGLRGGKARAQKLSAKKRSDIARNAAKVRWNK